MKQSLFLLFVFWTAVVPAQTTPAAPVMFYFPANYFSDSATLQTQLPQLAGALIGYYKKEAMPGDVDLCFLHGDDEQTLRLIDSAEKKTGNKTENFLLKTYALARLHQKARHLSFDDAYKQSFAAPFNALTFNQKMYVAGFDSATVAYLKKQYADRVARLKSGGADSIGLKEAKALCEDYNFGVTLPQIMPLFASLTNGREYKKKFPLIKSYPWAGVVPVSGIDEIADPALQYNLLMELTGFAEKGKDSSASKYVNGPLGEVARLMNLHAAAGIPAKKLHVVMVVHGPALKALLTSEAYKRKYGVDNPNLTLIKELQAAGVKMIACGQALFFFNLEKEDMAPGIKKALTAQTVLSSYQLKHYVYYNLSIRD